MHFLFIGRDKENRAEARAKTRDLHRAYIWRKDLRARLMLGSPVVEEGKMVGSMLLLDAPDLAAAEAYLDGDPYNRVDLFGTRQILELHEGFAPVEQWARSHS